MSTPELVAGRSCKGCTLCCLLVRVPELSKPRLQQCQHCEVNVGCKIYDHQPVDCQRYFCDYRRNPHLGEEWRPLDSHMVMSYEPVARRVDVQVDPAHPDAWRRDPYYAQLKIIATNAVRGKGYLIVWQGHDAIAILPDRDVNLGPVENEGVVITEVQQPDGRTTYDIALMAPGDPRRADLQRPL